MKLGSNIVQKPSLSTTMDGVLRPHYTHFKEIDSTHLFTKKQRSAVLQGELLIVSADHQTGGIGRRKDTWYGERGSSLLVSYGFLRKEAMPHALIFVLAGALCRFLEEEGLSPMIKWPNDIFLSGKKVAGLMEDVQDDFIVLSFGMNVNEESSFFYRHGLQATSLFLEKKVPFHVKSLLTSITDTFCTLLASEDMLKVVHSYCDRHLLWKNARVSVDGKAGILLGLDSEFRARVDVSGTVTTITTGTMREDIS